MFWKKKDKEVPAKEKEKAKEKEIEAFKEEMEEMDPLIRPGGVFIMQLLMKEPCEMPETAVVTDVLGKHLGEIEAFGDREVAASFALKDYLANFQEGQLSAQLMIGNCAPFDGEKIDAFQRSQMWDCREDRDRILTECKYQVLANDFMAGSLEPKIRANMVMNYLEALMEIYPQCEAVYFMNSGKLFLAEDIRSSDLTDLDRYIRFAVNVRFFNVQGTEESVVDTLGLSLLFMEDLQYHFHSMEPSLVVNHAYNVVSYLLENDNPIKDGDTIDGIEDGRIVTHIQWKCQNEESLVQPKRIVRDICMNQYAAGGR